MTTLRCGIRTRLEITSAFSISSSSRLYPFLNRGILNVGSLRFRFRSIDHGQIQPEAERITSEFISRRVLSGGTSRSRDTATAPISPMRMDTPNTASGRVSKRSSRDAITCGPGWDSSLLRRPKARRMCNGCRGAFGASLDTSLCLMGASAFLGEKYSATSWPSVSRDNNCSK